MSVCKEDKWIWVRVGGGEGLHEAGVSRGETGSGKGVES